MRKLTAFVLLLCALSACKSDKNLLTSIPADWQIDERIAKGMIDYYKGCKENCHNDSKATVDPQKEKQIIDAIKNIKEISWIYARYRKEDEERYGKVNGCEPAEKCLVAGYNTRILKVETDSDEEYYFDFVTICPPPPSCDTTQGPSAHLH